MNTEKHFCSSEEAEEICPGVTEARNRLLDVINQLKEEKFEPPPIVSGLIDCLVKVVDATNLDMSQRQQIVETLKSVILVEEESEDAVKH